MNSNSPAHSVGLYKFQQESLGLLTGVLDVPKAISYLIDEKGKPVCYKVHQLQPLMHREYLNTYHQYDPLYPTLFSNKDADVVKMSDLVSCYERDEHPYFQKFMRSATEAWQDLLAMDPEVMTAEMRSEAELHLRTIITPTNTLKPGTATRTPTKGPTPTRTKTRTPTPTP
jgi:hypothetical protein